MDKGKIKNNRYLYFSLAASLIFIISYLIIAWFNRFTKDDFDFLALSRDNTILDNIIYFYFNWEGPVGGLIIWFTSLSFFIHFQSPFVVNLISLVFILTGIAVFYKNLLKINTLLSLAIAGFISIDMYYNGLIIPEVWFWMNGNYVYLAFLGMILLGTGFLQSTKYYWFGIFIFLFAGSMRLNFSAILLTGFGLVFIYKIINKEKLNWRFYLPFFLLLAGTVVYVIAPGNYVRKSHYDISYNISDILSGVLTMSGDYLYRYVFIKFPFHFVFLFPISYLLYSLKNRYQVLKYLLTVRNVMKLMAFAFLILLVQNFIMYMARGYITPRTLTMVSFVFSSTLAITIAFIMSFIPSKIHIKLAYVTVILVSLLVFRRTYLNFPVVKKYANAVDQRTLLILDYKENYSKNPIDTLFVDPLPPSGWLHSSEIYPVDNPNSWSNNNFKHYYNLPFEVYGKKKDKNK